MKKIGTIIGFNLIAVLCVLLLLPGRAQAVDVNRECTLNICSVCDGTVLQGAGIRVYHLADLDGETGHFVAREGFKDISVNLNASNQTEWAAVAETLRGSIESGGREADWAGMTDGFGLITFGNLKCGLYLVICQDVTLDGVKYSAPSFCVALPGKDKSTGGDDYSVLSKPKYTGEGQKAETITIGVLKMWKDEGDEKQRPLEVTITLNQNGKPLEQVKLNSANKWRYVWKDLPADGSYSVSETQVKGYTCSVERDGNVFIVTNTKVPEVPTEQPTQPTQPTQPHTPSVTGGPRVQYKTSGKLPQTGQLWWPVIAFGCAGLVMTLLGLLLRRVRRDD